MCRMRKRERDMKHDDVDLHVFSTILTPLRSTMVVLKTKTCRIIQGRWS